MKKIIFWFILGLFLAKDISAQSQPEVLFEKALYQEEIFGNLEEAIAIYQDILKYPSLSERVEARVTLRLGLSYEKQGQLPEAIKCYTEVFSQFSQMPELASIAHNRLQENQRHSQINQLQAQLKKLEDSVELRAKYEAEIARLQKRISELYSDGALPPDDKELDREGDKIGNTLSDNLYKVGYNLYEKGHLRGAKESLKKAISFNPENLKATFLLKKVEDALEKLKITNVIDTRFPEDKNASSEKMIEVIDKEIKVQFYPLEDIFASLSEDTPFAQESFLELIKKQVFGRELVSENTLRMENSQLRVEERVGVHKKTQDVLEQIRENRKVGVLEVTLLSGSHPLLQDYLKEQKLVFTQTEAGVFHSYIDLEKSQVLVDLAKKEKDVAIYSFSKETVVGQSELKLEKIFEIPLVRGYKEQNLKFTLYQEGIRFIFDFDPNRSSVLANLFIKKINHPIEEIPTHDGLLQAPFFLQQSANISYDINTRKSLILLGLLNPLHSYQSIFEKKTSPRLLALISARIFFLEDYLAQEAMKEKETLVENSQDYYNAYYSIQPWQKIQDIQNIALSNRFRNEETRTQFMLRLCQEYLPDLSEGVIIKIVSPHLAVYGPKKTHEQIQKLLEGLRSFQDHLQIFSCYLLSVPEGKLDELVSSWSIPFSKKGKELQVYTLETSKEDFWREVGKSKDISLEFILNPIVTSNTQSLEIVNYQTKTFAKEILKNEEGHLQSKLEYMPQGVAIKLRPVKISSEESFVEITSEIYQLQEAFPKKEDQSLFHMPHLIIQKGHTRIQQKENQIYIMASFQADERSPNKELVFIIIPENVVSLEQVPIKGNHEIGN